MKPNSLYKSALSVLLTLMIFSCIPEEFVSPEIDVVGSWSQKTTTSEGAETLVFNFNGNNTFTSYTETCLDNDCIKEFGPDATWSIDGQTITVTFTGINVSKFYTVFGTPDSELRIQEGTNVLDFTRI